MSFSCDVIHHRFYATNVQLLCAQARLGVPRNALLFVTIAVTVQYPNSRQGDCSLAYCVRGDVSIKLCGCEDHAFLTGAAVRLTYFLTGMKGSAAGRLRFSCGGGVAAAGGVATTFNTGEEGVGYALAPMLFEGLAGRLAASGGDLHFGKAPLGGLIMRFNGVVGRTEAGLATAVLVGGVVVDGGVLVRALSFCSPSVVEIAGLGFVARLVRDLSLCSRSCTSRIAAQGMRFLFSTLRTLLGPGAKVVDLLISSAARLTAASWFRTLGGALICDLILGIIACAAAFCLFAWGGGRIAASGRLVVLTEEKPLP
jgi:hypothetical protein